MKAIIKSGVVKGSLQDVSERTGSPLATTFMNAAVAVLCDTSISMEDRDGQADSRYERMVQELAHLQNSKEGQVAVFSFSSDVVWCPGGVPTNLRGMTAMERGIDLWRKYNLHRMPDMQFFLISDGEPSNEQATLEAAQKFGKPINTIFVGDPDNYQAQDFLKQLARATRATHQDDFTVDKLADRIVALLPG